MLDADVIRRSGSPWSFPVVIVDKKDGNKRFCVDFRKLNQITKKNSHPLPLIDDILALLGKSKFFTSLDLKVDIGKRRIKRRRPLLVIKVCLNLMSCPLDSQMLQQSFRSSCL